MLRELAVLFYVVTAAACTAQNGESPNGGPAPAQAADTAHVRGTVAVVGSAPVSTAVVIRDGDGQRTRVEGPLAEEIGRLSGAEVEVTGPRQSDPMYGQSIRAEAYEVRSVDGSPVITGVVEQDAAGGLQLRTEDGRVVRLAGGAPHLRPGQKVWIRGPESVQVQSFGVIRP